MDVDKYIASGVLELYVAGLLNEDENLEVHRNAEEHPRIKEEIRSIEAAILALSKSAAYKDSGSRDFQDVIRRIGDKNEARVVPLPRKRATWIQYTGWAAALVLGLGLGWVYLQNTELKNQINLRSHEIQVLEDQIFEARNSLDKTRELLGTLRDREITVIALGGQEAAPSAYAKAYWNRAEEKVFIDAQGLPEPPPGMVYQVWSLKLSPLTPTSIGLLEDFTTDANRVFALSNPNDTEAFGITLEPAGGSETPTLEQLFTLGVVAS